MPAGDARAAHDQLDLRMTCEDSLGHGVDLSAIGDVAELVLGADFLRNGPQALLAARQEHALPAVGRESPGDCRPDPARAAGYERDAAVYRQTRRLRDALKLRPWRSSAVARSVCRPVFTLVMCQSATYRLPGPFVTFLISFSPS